MRFQNIPQFTRSGSYEVNIPWTSIERTLAQFQADYGLDLDPDFQRGHVWTAEKQSHYVEYILRAGEASRVLYFNCVGWGGGNGSPREMVLVDGKQRLEAVRAFLRNAIPAFGVLYADYTNRLHIGEHSFRFNVNDLATRAEVLRFYLDYNSGGVVHSEEELEKVRRLLAEEEGQKQAA